MNTSRCPWAPLLLLLAVSSQVSAQSTVESGLRELEETVRVLERRVTDLEEQLHERSAPAPVASDKLNWRKLQKGMSEGDVESCSAVLRRSMRLAHSLFGTTDIHSEGKSNSMARAAL